MFKRVDQAGIREDQILPSAHYMRHTHLSLLAHNGYSMAEIKEEQGVESRTTAKYYVHILDERDQEMADNFSASLGINVVSKCVICGVNLAIVFRKDRLKGSEESISICLFCDMELYNGSHQGRSFVILNHLSKIRVDLPCSKIDSFQFFS